MKRTISLILCLALCLGTVGVTVYAENAKKTAISDKDATEYISPDAQLAWYLSNKVLSSEQAAAARNKHNLGQTLARGAGLTRSANIPAKTLNVPWYRQPNEHYCGPATYKQTIQFLNGFSPTQEQIAFALGTTTAGTDTNNICVSLNLNTNCYYEVLWWWADADALADMVISDTDNNIPFIAHIIVPSYYLGEWLYPTGGHYLNYNGYSQYGEVFDVTDPFADRGGDTDGKYTVSKGEAYRVTDRIIW